MFNTLEPTRKAVPLERSSLCEWQRVWVHSYACRELRQSLFCSLFVTPGPWRERYLQLFFSTSRRFSRPGCGAAQPYARTTALAHQ